MRSCSWELTIFNPPPPSETVGTESDLETSPLRQESLGKEGAGQWSACSGDCYGAVADSMSLASGFSSRGGSRTRAGGIATRP